MNAVKASAANAPNAPSATQIANAPEASAAAAGNAAAAANGRADHKPVAAAEEAVFRDGPVVPAVSEALRVVPVDSCGCFRSWLRSTRMVTAKSPPRKLRQHPPRSRSWTKTMTAN